MNDESIELLPAAGQIFNIYDSSNIPEDIICNGFSIKCTILQVLKMVPVDLINLEELAQKITDALAIKLRLKQGAL